MGEKIRVDKDFLMKVLNHVDDLTNRLKFLEDNSSKQSINFDEFCSNYNRMIERNLKQFGIEVIPQ